MTPLDKSAEAALAAFQQFHSHKVAALNLAIRDRDDDITRISGTLDEAADRIDALQREVDEWADKYAESEDLRARLNRDVAGLEATLEAVRLDLRETEFERQRAQDKLMAGSGVTEEMPVIHEPVAKSAVEIPRGDTPDEGEGRIIAFMPISELEPGMKFRLDNAQVFEEALYVEHDVLSESIFGYDDRASVKVTVAWGGSGHFRPERIIQVDTTPLSH